MRVLPFVAAAVLWAPRPAPAQAPPAEAAQPPVFAVGVDVVAVDASVRGPGTAGRARPRSGGLPGRGRGGRGRGAARSVEYVGRDLEPGGGRPGLAGASAPTSTRQRSAGPPARGPGNIGRGGGREVFKSASRFLDGLAPADRVGLAFIPGPGSAIEFTAEVEDVRRGLKGLVGTANRAGHKVPLAEAIAKIKTNERLRWEQFLALQCGGSLPEGAFVVQTNADEAVPFAVVQLVRCQRELEQDAQQVYQEYREEVPVDPGRAPGDAREPRAHRGPEDGRPDLGRPRDRVGGRAARPRGRPLRGPR